MINLYVEAMKKAPKLTKANKLICLLTIGLVVNLAVSTSMIAWTHHKHQHQMRSPIMVMRNALHSIIYFQFWLIPYMTWTMSADCSDVIDIMTEDINKSSTRMKGTGNSRV